MIKVRNDLTNKVCGNFLVLSQVEDYISPKGSHRAQWLCKCLLCGNDKVIIMDTVLQSQSKKSCGCLENLIGKRFGRLIVVNKDGKDNNGNTMWQCNCDCGNSISVRYNRLTSGNVKSCGCLRADSAKEKFSKNNVFDLTREYGVGYTTNTNQPFYFDLKDYDLIQNYTWYEDVSKNGYRSLKAKDKETGNIVKMSYLLGCKYYDHKDRNPLNNRRSNLRPATESENAKNKSKSKRNTSGVTGVSWDKECCKWLAYIKVNKTRKNLGRYIDKQDAIKARLQAEAKYFKEFAPQRHLFKQYGVLEDDFLDS